MISIDNRFTRKLPADTEAENYIRQVESACYSFCRPKLVKNPELVLRNDLLADELGFDVSFYDSEQFVKVFSGSELLTGMQPYAMCYGGHQFGNWAGQLGDGRAINLAEIATNQGHQTLQLKGAGITPYSRHADGLAVLRSSIREYLCSEAMFHLKVPTTRALSLILTGDLVERDMFYDGNPKFEPGAVVCRVAPSFIRFGSFEIFASRGDQDSLQKLIDYCIEHDYAEMDFLSINNPSERYIAWFKEIAKRSCDMVVDWQRVGFVHGVMNTDNMSILGLTIDYGPYGWIDEYDPSWTPNTTDLPGRRYCFANQARMVHWNLVQLAQALVCVVENVDALQQIVNDFPNQYEESYLKMMAKKLGLVSVDVEFVQGLEEVLIDLKMDMTLFFRQLADYSGGDCSSEYSSDFSDVSYLEEEDFFAKMAVLNKWLKNYSQRITLEGKLLPDRQKIMNENNPCFVLRNYLSQQAIEAAEQGDFALLFELHEALETPYQFHEKFQKFYGMRPDWAKEKAGCSMLSCSS